MKTLKVTAQLYTQEFNQTQFNEFMPKIEVIGKNALQLKLEIKRKNKLLEAASYFY